jgi:hypothetical protein
MTGSSPETTTDAGTTEAVDTEITDVSATATSSTAEDASTAADPSTAKDKGAQPSLLDSVKRVLSGKAAEKAGSPDATTDPDATSKATDADGKDPTAEQELGELTEKELKTYAPKTQRRILSLLNQRGEYEKRATAAEAEAEVSRKITGFANEHGLSGEDVEGLLEIGALVRGDPFKAIERLTPIYSELLKRTGHVLPAEIQDRVKQGYITEEDARRLVAAETREVLAKERQEAMQKQADEDRLRGQAQAHVNDVKTVAADWEATRKRTDPDWSLKQPRVGELIELEVHRNGYPKSKADVVKMLDDIAKKVDEDTARFKPKPREVKPAQGGASSGATAAPKDVYEAVRRGLGK